jgi:hypothetical protein
VNALIATPNGPWPMRRVLALVSGRMVRSLLRRFSTGPATMPPLSVALGLKELDNNEMQLTRSDA